MYVFTSRGSSSWFCFRVQVSADVYIALHKWGGERMDGPNAGSETDFLCISKNVYRLSVTTANAAFFSLYVFMW